MRDVAIVDVGMTPVGEHWNKSLRTLATEAVHDALNNANLNTIDALYVGNAYGSSLSEQTQLGALIADHSGLTGIEAYTVEAGNASGGVALRTAYMAVASGVVETALVVGVEKSSDAIASAGVRGRTVSLDGDFEASQGATLSALAAMVMRRYMHEYDLEPTVFEGFSVNAHANAQTNPNAMFRNRLRPGAFAKAPMVADPVNLFDGAPDADGAAALILTSLNRARSMTDHPVRIAGSAVATDTLALQDRGDLLYLKAVSRSTHKALVQAMTNVGPVDLYELHDAYTILTTLTLEAMGMAEKGPRLALSRVDRA